MTKANAKPADIEHAHAVVWIDHLTAKIFPMGRAGVGEVVMFASGSSARQTQATKDRPVDATIMAIVDVVDMDGRVRYQK